MRLGSFVLLASLALAVRTARADCIARSACICAGDARASVDGVVLSVTNADAVLRVDAIEGDTSVATVGATITMVRGKANEGERWLASQSISDDAWRPFSKVKSDGNAACEFEPDFRITARDALNLSVATNCNTLFESSASEQGIGAQDCNDVVNSPIDLFGCHCSGASAASMLALLPLLLRRRRAR